MGNSKESLQLSAPQAWLRPLEGQPVHFIVLKPQFWVIHHHGKSWKQ